MTHARYSPDRGGATNAVAKLLLSSSSSPSPLRTPVARHELGEAAPGPRGLLPPPEPAPALSRRRSDTDAADLAVAVSEPEAFQLWRLQYEDGGPGAVRVSEFTDNHPVALSGERRESYRRPTNKRDLGHRCAHCRQPFGSLGVDIVAEPSAGPSHRFHAECWKRSCNGPRSVAAGDVGDAPLESPGVVPAYAEMWRRSSLSSTRRRSSRGRQLPSPSVLDGLVVTEGPAGKKVSTGFTQRELDALALQWGGSEPDGECAICLVAGHSPLRLPCGHAFCAECVSPWLRKCALCPLCRSELRQPPSSRATRPSSVSSSRLAQGGLARGSAPRSSSSPALYSEAARPRRATPTRTRAAVMDALVRRCRGLQALQHRARGEPDVT